MYHASVTVCLTRACGFLKPAEIDALCFASYSCNFIPASHWPLKFTSLYPILCLLLSSFPRDLDCGAVPTPWRLAAACLGSGTPQTYRLFALTLLLTQQGCPKEELIFGRDSVRATAYLW